MLLGLLLVISRLSGQTDTLRAFTSKIGLKSSVSHSGISAGVQYKISRSNLILGIGPKTEIDRNAGYLKIPAGITSDLEIILLRNRKLESSVNLDYQLLFVRKECNGSCRKKTDRIHEYTAGFGVRIKAGRSIWILNRVNVGRYTESLYSNFFDSYLRFSDFNTMVLLGMEVKL